MAFGEKVIIVPVYNEVKSARGVIDSILRHKDADTMLIVVQDGSDDGTAEVLREMQSNGFFDNHRVKFLDHHVNQGYGKALLSGFREAVREKNCRYILTMDCDEQHQPEDIPKFFSWPPLTVLSGSRYLDELEKGIKPPRDRVQINRKITEKYQKKAMKRFGVNWKITDSFCGMKRYEKNFIRDFLDALEQTNYQEEYLGYGFPLLVWNFFLDWLEKNSFNLIEHFAELGIPKIYISDDRTFGENLDFPAKRYRYYLGCMKVNFKDTLR